MSSSLKPFCVLKQGRMQWSSWTQRIVTVDTDTECLWVSKKHREDMPHYHKLALVEVQPWRVYKEKYIDEDVWTKEAMLTVRVKAYEVPALPQEKYGVQRCLLQGNAADQGRAATSSFGVASPVASAATSSRTSPSTAAQQAATKRNTVDCVLRFTSAESLLEFTNAIMAILLRRGDTSAASQLLSARDRAVTAVEQLAVRGDERDHFTHVM